MKIEKLDYEAGWQRIFYVAINENPMPPIRVSCHSPEGTNTVHNPLKLLEAGVHYFKFYFGLGKYIFIFYESDVPQLIAIITVRK